MNDGPFEAKGYHLYIGKYHLRLWWTLFDISDGCNGRVHFFWWHPMRLRKLLEWIEEHSK